MAPQGTSSHFIHTKILVPVDFSSSSDASLETASDLAQHSTLPAKWLLDIEN
jgi:hypothetical protein